MSNEEYQEYMLEIINMTAELNITDEVFIIQLYTILIKYSQKGRH